MSEPAADVFDFDTTYVHLADGPTAARIVVGPDFWQKIGERTDIVGGRLVTLHRQSETWPHWEMHPAGDEIVYALGGSFDFVLDEPDGERVIPMRGRGAVVVPQGIWHRAVVHEPGDVLFITRGEGTQHRPV